MTGGSDVREKTRAVFLAFIMVTSVFGATVALSGSAAAATNTTIVPGSQTAGETTQFTVTSTLDGATTGNGNNIQTIEINTGGADDDNNPNFADVQSADILRIGEDTDNDGTIETDFSHQISSVSTGANDGILQITLNDNFAVSDNNQLIVEFADAVNPANTGDATITVTVEDFTSDSENDDATLSVTEELEVSASPSPATRGETANVNVDIDNQDGSDFTGQAQVAIVGLTNTNDDTAASPGEGDETSLDSSASARDYTVIKSGSTTSGSFTTSITLRGTGQTGGGNDRAIGEYFVVVRRGATTFSAVTPFSGPNPDNADNVVTNNFDGSSLLDATPDGTVDVTDVTRGDSPTVSGSVTVSDGSGLSNYPVTIQNINASSQVGSTTTADNGDYATTETVADAAQHSVALELYNTSTNSLENVNLDTFDVAPNSLSVSTSSSSFTASVAKSDSITLTADGADTQESATDVNVTRFRLSGLALSEVDVTSDGNQFIDKVTLTDGTEIGNLDTTEEFDDTTANPDGDGTDEIDDGASADGRIVTTSNANIETIVLGTDDSAPNGDNDLDVQLFAPSAGDLTVEGQVEDTAQGADTSNTPTAPDFVGTQTITAEEPGDLNVDVSPTSIAIDDGDADVTVTVRDADGNGLINDGALSSGDIESLEFEFAGNGTQFEAEVGADGDLQPQGQAGEAVTFAQGQNLDTASATIDNDDVGNERTQFVVQNVLPEQNGTIDVTVTAGINGQSNDVTDSASVTAGDSFAVEGLPSGQLTVGTVTDLNISVTDGAGTPLNSKQVRIGDDGTDNDVFAIDTDGDGSDEITGVDAIELDGSSGEVGIEQAGDGGFDSNTISNFNVNNGEYQLSGVNITAPGQSVPVTVTGSAGTDVKAFFPSQFNTVGESAFTVSADVDPMVAGFSEQVNLTVTNASGGQVTGTALNNILSDDGATNDEITQTPAETQVAGEFGTADTADTDGDGTDDVIQTTFAPTSTDTLNITVDTNGGAEVGTGTIEVVEPDVQTNVENNVLTERLNQSIDVTVIDPRDGSRLGDDDDSADVRVSVRNGTLELNDPNGDVDTVNDANQNNAPNFEFDDDDDGSLDGVVANNLVDSNVTVNALPYDPDNEQFTLEIEVDSDTGNFFGSTNLTVEPPQVTASPSSVELGSQQTLQITAEDANGNALGNRNVRLDGAVSTITGSTDASGFVAVTVNPSATGVINVHTASDNDLDTAGTSPAGLAASDSVEDTVNVTTEQNEFNVTVDPQTVTANESSTVTVTATNNASGDAVEGASVDLSGAGVNQSAQTDANGQATFDVNASQTGTIDVTVDDAGFTAATASITVQQPSEPVATVTFDDQTVQNGTEEVTVESANFTRADGSAGDYVVVVHVVNATDFDGGVDNSISAPVGASENLSNGAENITVELNSSAAFEDGDARDSLTENVTLRAMLHTTDNESAFGTRLGVAIDGLEPGDETDDANITVQEEAGVPEDPAERALQAAGVNNASAIEQSDITTLITLRDRGDPANGVDVTQDDITNLITLRDRAQ